MSHPAHRLAFATGLAAYVLAGCGSGGAETNGLEEMSAAEVLQEAAAALTSAESVHVTGTSIDEEAPGELDLRIQGDSSHGTLTVEGVTLEIIVIGEDTYLKSDERGLENAGAPAEAQRLGAGRWLKLDPEVSSFEGFARDDIAAQLTEYESPLEPEVEQTTLDGERVVVVRREDGAEVYVANVGAAYPLRGKGPNEGQIDFTEYGADFDITAPEDAVEISELGAADSGPLTEELWLEKIATVRTQIDVAFASSDLELTSSVMVTLATALRACSSELASTGPPSDRVQEIYALVQQACQEYDKGADCFTEAAEIGIPEEGSAEDLRSTEAIDCGFAAQGLGGELLAEAEIKGMDLQQTPSG